MSSSSYYSTLRFWRTAQRSLLQRSSGTGRPVTSWKSTSRELSAPRLLSTSSSSSSQSPAVVTATLSSSEQPWSHYGWPLREPEEGTGFDNFLKRQPKDQKSSNRDSSGSSSKKNKKESHHNNNSNGKGDNNNNNSNNGLMILATMILASAFIFSQSDSSEDDGRGNVGRGQGGSSLPNGPSGAHHLPNNSNNNLDLTWHEFLQLLEQDAIFKIVIHQGPKTSSSKSGDDGNPTRARVYLKPGANLNLMTNSQGGNSHHHSMDDHVTATGQHEPDKTEWTSSTDNLASTDIPLSGRTAATATPLVYRNLRVGSASSLERKLEEAQRALHRSPAQDIPVQYQVESGVTHELLGLLPWLMVSGFILAMFRGAAGRMSGGLGAPPGGGAGGGPGGGMFGMGKSTAQKFTKEMNINIGFRDVAGCNEAKKEIMEFVEFLQTPDRFTELGAKIPKGALLAGPPGTGKTLLAKAVAGEAGVPFYSLAGSEFLEMFVGVGPSRVRDLFREARENAPCIIFIDEIDAIGRKRGKSSAVGGNDERENTLNQLLVEMDGFDPSAGVICLAGTNRDDVLDPALTRPGRFDRKIQVDLPDIQGRKEVFQVHLKNITLVEELGPAKARKDDKDESDDEDTEQVVSHEHQVAIDKVASRLAGLTPGFSGADIANICNEAAIVAARRNADAVIMDDFEKATDRVIGGLESNRIMSPAEKKIVAHHEAGHAVAGWFLEHADPLLKVTIIPRASGALGFAQYLPKEVHLRTQDQIMDIVAMALAGRAAEEVFFGRVTTGASDDLKRVTQMVYSTIQLYGMNHRLGQLSFPKDPTAMWEERRYSEKTAKAMDEEAKDIVDKAYQRTLDLIRERKKEVELVANLLLEKETINHDEVYDLIGARPFKGDKSYNEYVSKRESERLEKEAQEADGAMTDDANAPTLNPSL